MTQDFFRTQIVRLQARFGQKAFDPEFVLLVWRETGTMSDVSFARFVDVLIGSRTPNKPPLLSDFREARFAEEKLKHANSLAEVARNFEKRTGKSPLEVLKPYVGRVNSIQEAIEVRRLQILAEKEKNPDYDPMTDPKWTGG